MTRSLEDYRKGIEAIEAGFEYKDLLVPATLQDIYPTESLERDGYDPGHIIGSALVKACSIYLAGTDNFKIGISGKSIKLDEASCLETPLQRTIDKHYTPPLITDLVISWNEGEQLRKIGGLRFHDLDTLRAINRKGELAHLLTPVHKQVDPQKAKVWLEAHEHFELSSVERDPLLPYIDLSLFKHTLPQTDEQFYVYTRWLSDQSTVNLL